MILPAGNSLEVSVPVGEKVGMSREKVAKDDRVVMTCRLAEWGTREGVWNNPRRSGAARADKLPFPRFHSGRLDRAADGPVSQPVSDGKSKRRELDSM